MYFIPLRVSKERTLSVVGGKGAVSRDKRERGGGGNRRWEQSWVREYGVQGTGGTTFPPTNSSTKFKSLKKVIP